MSILKKLSSGKGTTLGEMLVSVLILMMLTMAVAGGTGIAAKVYRTEKAYSESRILANSILLAMTEELRYASGLTVGKDGMSVSYDSRVYGAGTTMGLDLQGTDGTGGTIGADEAAVTGGKGGADGTGAANGGMLKVTYRGGQGETGSRTDYLYRENTYSGYRIQARKGQDMFVRDGNAVVISYDICDSHGNVKASLEKVKIRLLNGEAESGDEKN